MNICIGAGLGLLLSASAATAHPGWITASEAAYVALQNQGFGMTRHGQRTLGNEQVTLLEVRDRDMDELKGVLHRQLGHCGGFMYHDNEAEGRAALERVGAKVSLKLTRPSYVIAQQAVVTPLLAQMQEAQLVQTISRLAAFTNRYYSSEHGVNASNWLSRTWASMGAQHSAISVAQFAHEGYPQASVVATIAGTDKADEIIVLGAHLDSINLLGRRAQTVAPGADDDASGIAGLTEVLRVIAANDYRPRRTIKLIGYAAEEVGLRGSQDIARAFKKNALNVVGVLQLDMTNFKGSSQDIYLISDYTDVDQNAFIGGLVAEYLPALSVGVDKCGYACSDHAAWTAQGYAASMPFEAKLSQDNPHIHSRNDTLANSGEQAAHALKFARMAAAYAIELGSE